MAVDESRPVKKKPPGPDKGARLPAKGPKTGAMKSAEVVKPAFLEQLIAEEAERSEKRRREKQAELEKKAKEAKKRPKKSAIMEEKKEVEKKPRKPRPSPPPAIPSPANRKINSTGSMDRSSSINGTPRVNEQGRMDLEAGDRARWDEYWTSRRAEQQSAALTFAWSMNPKAAIRSDNGYYEGERAVVCDGKLILYGGKCNGNFNRLVCIIDTASSSWRHEVLSKEPPGRIGHDVIIFEKEILVYGGHTKETQYSADLIAIDTNNWRWRQIEMIAEDETSQKDAPIGRAYHSFTRAGRHAFIFGGVAAPQVVDGPPILLNHLSVLTLDEQKPQLNHSREQVNGESPCPRHSHSCVYVERKQQLLLYGGVYENQYLDDAWIYTMSSKSWSRVELKGNVPRPRFVSTVCTSVVGDGVIFFGAAVQQGTTTADESTFALCFGLLFLNLVLSLAVIICAMEYRSRYSNTLTKLEKCQILLICFVGFLGLAHKRPTLIIQCIVAVHFVIFRVYHILQLIGYGVMIITLEFQSLLILIGPKEVAIPSA